VLCYKNEHFPVPIGYKPSELTQKIWSVENASSSFLLLLFFLHTCMFNELARESEK